MASPIVCLPRMLPRQRWIAAADNAVRINPHNHAPVDRLAQLIPGFQPTREYLAAVTAKYWHSGGVKLTVGFLDNPPADLRKRILAHMNAWNKTANVSFVLASKNAQVRIARAEDGYWSYIGTDILSIEPDQPTMNLQEFTMQTPDREFHRVVRHETGHTLGFPHEHMRKELVDKIDPDKAIRFFGQTQGWSPDMVKAQVLTPLEEGSLISTDHCDPNSIMCYQIPGTITKDGQPIVGGLDIDASDYSFAGKLYPRKKVRSKPHKKKSRARKRTGRKARKKTLAVPSRRAAVR